MRDPVTQQFVHTSHTTFTGVEHLASSLKGIYRTSLVNSVELSAVVAVIGAVIGILLAYAVVTSESRALRQIVIAAAAVTANFGGIPLAFLFIATVGNAGILTVFLQDHFNLSLQDDLHFRLTTISGISLVYLYFLIPLMVLVMTPALEGLKPEWSEAAENLGASRWHYWRYVAGPVLAAELPRLGAAAVLLLVLRLRHRLCAGRQLVPAGDHPDLRRAVGQRALRPGEPRRRARPRHDRHRASDDHRLPGAAAANVEVAGMTSTGPLAGYATAAVDDFLPGGRRAVGATAGGGAGAGNVIALDRSSPSAAIYFIGPLIAAISFTVQDHVHGGITLLGVPGRSSPTRPTARSGSRPRSRTRSRSRSSPSC